MREILSPAQAEIDVKKSRFLAEVFAVSSQEDARAKLKSQKQKYDDATHVVHAFIVGPTAGVLGSSDDGEPSGTAGRPVLDALKGTGLTNVMVTVTRWFGGTLLGTGGLVKAYAEAVKAALAAVESREIVLKAEFTVTLSYEAYERVKREFTSFHVELTAEEFGVDVILRGTLPEEHAEAFSARLGDLSSGRSHVVLSR